MGPWPYHGQSAAARQGDGTRVNSLWQTNAAYACTADTSGPPYLVQHGIVQQLAAHFPFQEILNLPGHAVGARLKVVRQRLQETAVIEGGEAIVLPAD
jgi:hypothetical protein